MKKDTDNYIYTDIPYSAGRMQRAEQVLLVALSLVFINEIVFVVLGFLTRAKYLVVVPAVFAGAALVILLLRNRLSYRAIAYATIWLSSILIVTIVIFFEGSRPSDDPVIHLWFAVIAVGTWLILRSEDEVFSNIYVALCFLAFLCIEFSIVSIAPLITHPPEIHQFAQTFTLVSIFISLLAITHVYLRDISDAERQLSLANARLEELLANMLPASISERLRAEGQTFADGYANTSVLFADLVGFTSMSAKMSPMSLVKLLDGLFSSFDLITEELGLEKIKTIGDAYMVAAGLPEPRADHASALVELALRIRAEISSFSNLEVRIGINSGEVVAGIIGRKRFIYDLWGDTVNIASRMESHGIVNEIQISASTYAEVKNLYDCEPRGEIELKGRGKKDVYLVRGRRISGRDERPAQPFVTAKEEA